MSPYDVHLTVELRFCIHVDTEDSAKTAAASASLFTRGWWRDRQMARRGHDLTLLGTRANESHQRQRWLRQVRAEHGASVIYPVSSGTGRRCCPIWDWSSDDIWALIAGWQLPYNTAYDRLHEIGISRERQRIGPLPLTPRQTLADGWPDLLEWLEARYGERWS